MVNQYELQVRGFDSPYNLFNFPISVVSLIIRMASKNCELQVGLGLVKFLLGVKRNA